MKQLLAFTLADLVGVMLGLVAAYALRFGIEIVPVTKPYSPHEYLRLLPVAALIWVFWLDSVGCYSFQERAFNLQILHKLFRAGLLATMTIVAIHFFVREHEYSRLIYPLSLLSVTTCLALERLLLDRILAHLRRSGRLPSAAVLILGAGRLGASVAERISNHAYLGMHVAGFVTTGSEEVHVDKFPVLGDFSRIREIIREQRVDEVIVAQPDLNPSEILQFMLECEKEIVSIRVVPTLLEAMLVEMSVEQIDNIPLFGLKESPLQGWNLVVKRLFDIGLSLFGLIVLSPLLLLLAIAVKLTSPGPVLYKQKRVGIDGRRFNIYKFRSMRVDAEDASGPVWASPDDERKTLLGAFMRAYNLDELPQLWNVLRGDMSLVGPRPERPHFVKQFREAVPRYMVRHRVRSGITGWAQVNGLRGQTSIDERLKYDLYYIENWSIWLDCKILFLTLLTRKNAY